MSKYYSTFLIISVLCSCGSVQKHTNNNQPNSKYLFSLETTSCLGPCPVFNFYILKDSTLLFEGIENTFIVGKTQLDLRNEEFTQLQNIIETVDWGKLNKKYTSDLSDLPTQKFYNNFNDANIKVYQYGIKPSNLYSLCDQLYKYVQLKIDQH